ncbi:hypothetical protein ACFL1E_04400 [Candidatus Omnitrophota bacterium]
MIMDTSMSFAIQFFMRLMIALAFACSLFLLVTPDAYLKFSKLLQKEYGMKKKVLPVLEKESGVIDNFLLRYRMLIGILLLFISILLLARY